MGRPNRLSRALLVALLAVFVAGGAAPASARPEIAVVVPSTTITDMTLLEFDVRIHADDVAHLRGLQARRIVRIAPAPAGTEVALDVRLRRNGHDAELRGYAVVGVKRGPVKPIEIGFTKQPGTTYRLKKPVLVRNMLRQAAAGGRLSGPADAFLRPSENSVPARPRETFLGRNLPLSRVESVIRSILVLTSSAPRHGYTQAEVDLFNGLGLGAESSLSVPPPDVPPLPARTPPAERFWLRAKAVKGSIVHPAGRHYTGDGRCGVSPPTFLATTASASGSAFWFETFSSSPSFLLSTKVPAVSVFYSDDSITAGYGSNVAGFVDIVVGAASCSDDPADVGGEVIELTSHASWRPRARQASSARSA